MTERISQGGIPPQVPYEPGREIAQTIGGKIIFVPLSEKPPGEFYFQTKIMAILGNIIARSLKIRKQFRLHTASPITYQQQTLKRLLETAQYTAFGRHYGFTSMLDQERDLYRAFRDKVPI